MRPTLVSTGKSCTRRLSSRMHATLLRPRPAGATHRAKGLMDKSYFHMSNYHCVIGIEPNGLT